MKKLLAIAALNFFAAGSAYATSTYSCQVVEVNGLNYSFSFSASRTAGESLVNGRVLMDANLGGVAEIYIPAERIVQYWNDGHDFKVAVIDDMANYIKYKIEVTKEPSFGREPANYSGRALIKMSGKERPTQALAQCQITG